MSSDAVTRIGRGRRKVVRAADSLGCEDGQAGALRNEALGFHPIARDQALQLADGRFQQDAIMLIVLNGQVIRIGDPDGAGGDLAGDDHLLAFIGGDEVAAGARAGLLEREFGLSRCGDSGGQAQDGESIDEYAPVGHTGPPKYAGIHTR